MNLEKLKELRIQKGYTQREMAEKLGFKSKSSYNQIEKGKTKIDILLAKKISEILNEDLEKIFL